MGVTRTVSQNGNLEDKLKKGDEVTIEYTGRLYDQTRQTTAIEEITKLYTSLVEKCSGWSVRCRWEVSMPGATHYSLTIDDPNSDLPISFSHFPHNTLPQSTLQLVALMSAILLQIRALIVPNLYEAIVSHRYEGVQERPNPVDPVVAWEGARRYAGAERTGRV
jgi:hypothetical protein